MAIKKRDKELRQHVIDALDWEPSIDSNNIGVTVSSGVVTLTGHVITLAEKRQAEKTALSVAGVKGLANEIEVTLVSAHKRTDTDIAKAALSRINDHVQLSDQDVQISVNDGRVTLDGSVDWHYQRRRAEETVRYIRGVREIQNNLTVKPATTPANLRGRIRTALERRVDKEAAGIDIEIAGSAVTLTGTVRSWADREDIERAVWASPGITDVTNKLVVGRGVAA
ncbi:BON domain-containing protein [Longibacter salinarum]|nr:BON domain-containing protein [Longibacter salinarum]